VICSPFKKSGMKKIKTFADACKALGLSTKALPDVSLLTKQQAKGVTAHFKLMVIAEALNDGWKPNWKDTNEWRFYPWFALRGGSGFRLAYVDYRYAGSLVGSRLCFKSREIAEYAGKQFIKLYKDYMTM
jgi:hypothetical protein